MTPKDWNTQEEAIAAAKAEILAAIGSTDARLELGMVKSVQRGVITFHSTKDETVKISPVDITKSIILHGGAMPCSGIVAHNPDYWDAQLQLIDATTITATKNYNANGLVTTISWQVIEFY